MPPTVAAMAWFTRETYAAHLALDPAGLPATFDQWQRRARDMQQETQRRLGVVVEAVELDPERLADWCRARGRDVDAKARAEFAIELWGRRRHQ